MWPARITDGRLELRPLRRRDAQEWSELRRQNAGWLAPWEATVPASEGTAPMTFGQWVRESNRTARAGQSRPWVVTRDGVMVGQVTVSGITRGSLSSAAIGYWVSRHVAGRGITPRAVALAIDDCFGTLGLHRVEINIRPENAASLRVVAKLGLRDEGVRKAYLHIQGQWADHRTFAITAEELLRDDGAAAGGQPRPRDPDPVPLTRRRSGPAGPHESR